MFAVVRRVHNAQMTSLDKRYSTKIALVGTTLIKMASRNHAKEDG